MDGQGLTGPIGNSGEEQMTIITPQMVKDPKEDETDHLRDRISRICLDGRSDRDVIRKKMRLWLNQILRIVITDERIIIGCFVCTDRDANVILENSWEYSPSSDGISRTDNQEPRLLGLTLIPGRHIVSVAIMATYQPPTDNDRTN